MKKVTLLIPLLLLFGYAHAGDYEAYYQISPAAEKNHMFVLITLKNMHNDNDVSMANFVLEPGEDAKKVMGHVDYPKNKYIYKIQCIKEHGNIFILTDVSVTNGDKTMYKTKQQLSGFAAP